MITTTQHVTAEELLRMPDDGFRYELIRGELKKMSPAEFQHGIYASRIAASLIRYERIDQMGEVCIADTGFILSSNPDTVRVPDVAFVSRERVQQVGYTKKYFPGAPDLAVEVISPSDAYSEVREKVFDWLDAGCRMVVVVDPSKQTVTVYRNRADVVELTEDDTLEGGDVVPGWTLPVKKIFALP